MKHRTSQPEADHAAVSGFTLIEVLVALLITVIAVMGLAHTLGIGRGLIDRYAAARSAAGVAQSRMESLRMEYRKDLTNPDLAPTVHPVTDVTLDGHVPGQETWTVEWVDDPLVPGTQDYKRVRVIVTWSQAGTTDTVGLQSVFLAR